MSETAYSCLSEGESFSEGTYSVGGKAEGQLVTSRAAYYIKDFAGEPHTIIKPIPVAVTPMKGEVIASFEQANIAMSGATQVEAIAELSSYLLDVFDSLFSETAPLGPEPARQLDLLQRYIGKP